MSLKQLIENCKINNTKAQGELYKLFSGKLFAICLKYSRNYAEAEDNLQDAFLTIFNKIEQYNELVKKYNLKPENVLYMGDDIPDYPVMKLVGLSCCPNDAAPEIQKISRYISYKKGGEGCVRDIIEQVLKVQGKWDSNFDAKYD